MHKARCKCMNAIWRIVCQPFFSLRAPHYFLCVIKGKASFSCDRLKPCLTFYRCFKARQRAGKEKKTCMCVLSNQEQTADILMAFLAAGVFERIFSTKKKKKGWIPVSSFDPYCLWWPPAGPQFAAESKTTQPLLLSAPWRPHVQDLHLLLFTVCFYNSLEDRSAELIGHLHLLDFNEAN